MTAGTGRDGPRRAPAPNGPPARPPPPRGRADGGRERDGVEPAALGKDRLQPPHQLERSLDAVLLLERVQVAEAGEADDALVDARIVLHRAGAERVETGVDPEVAGRELREV